MYQAQHSRISEQAVLVNTEFVIIEALFTVQEVGSLWDRKHTWLVVGKEVRRS
jgi:hypothetical protein